MVGGINIENENMYSFDVTEKDFEEKVLKLSEQKPVIVDFWAAWCMPCRLLAPILEKIVEELEGKVYLAKVNVDENPELAVKYEIMSIPHIKLFKNRKVVDEFVGLHTQSEVKKWILKNLEE